MSRLTFDEIDGDLFQKLGYEYENDKHYYKFFTNSFTKINLIATKKGSYGKYATIQLTYEHTVQGFDLRTERFSITEPRDILKYETRLLNLINLINDQ